MEQKTTINGLSLQEFMDTRYYRFGGYLELCKRFERGETNSQIARAFTAPGHRPMAVNTVRNWRQVYEAVTV